VDCLVVLRRALEPRVGDSDVSETPVVAHDVAVPVAALEQVLAGFLDVHVLYGEPIVVALPRGGVVLDLYDALRQKLYGLQVVVRNVAEHDAVVLSHVGELAALTLPILLVVLRLDVDLNLYRVVLAGFERVAASEKLLLHRPIRAGVHAGLVAVLADLAQLDCPVPTAVVVRLVRVALAGRYAGPIPAGPFGPAVIGPARRVSGALHVPVADGAVDVLLELRAQLCREHHVDAVDAVMLSEAHHARMGARGRVGRYPQV